METIINHDDWTKLDQQHIGWEGADMYVKDVELPTIGVVINAERNSPDGRSPFFLLCIGEDVLFCTVLQGNTLGMTFDIEGTP